MMYFPDVPYIAADYIKTSTGNIVSRKAMICKPQVVELPGGRCIIGDNVVIRGDLAPIQINKYSNIGTGTVLHPCTIMTTPISNSTTPILRFVPMTIGSHCQIGTHCTIEAAVIGMGCMIGSNCIISPRVVIKDFVIIQDNTTIPPDMVIAPFSIVSGKPGQVVGEAPESTTTLAVTDAVRRYKCWKPSL